MHVRQYRPAFFSGFENQEADVGTYNEFLSLPFIARLFQPEVVPGFVRLKAGVYTDERLIISGIYADQKSFVVAFATGPDRHTVLQPILQTE